ncbi:hypothetical protein PanWU01x14_059840, partial [Parasponia andersonii]
VHETENLDLFVKAFPQSTVCLFKDRNAPYYLLPLFPSKLLSILLMLLSFSINNFDFDSLTLIGEHRGMVLRCILAEVSGSYNIENTQMESIIQVNYITKYNKTISSLLLPTFIY